MYIVNMNISICWSSGKTCDFFSRVFQDIQLPKHTCDTQLDFAESGKTHVYLKLFYKDIEIVLVLNIAEILFDERLAIINQSINQSINLTIDDDKFLLLFITQNKNIISAYRASLSDLYMDYCIIMFICIIPISILSTTHMFKTIYKQ